MRHARTRLEPSFVVELVDKRRDRLTVRSRGMGKLANFDVDSLSGEAAKDG